MPEAAPVSSAIVIGAGWAGCASAVTLARRGVQVTLLEAARVPGGRARAIELDGRRLDNGQHILLGAYARTLALLATLGVRERDRAWLRLPLQMRYPKNCDAIDFVAPRLPAPLHVLVALWRAEGLTRDDKFALAQFSSTARWAGWRINDDCSVEELLTRWQQTPRLTALLWRPLCIAALNTPPARASAQIFLNVLRDSLGARRAASDMLIPTEDLGTLLPLRAAAYVGAHGGAVQYGARVHAIARTGARWQADTAGGRLEADAVIIATGAQQAARLLASSGQLDTAPLQACLDSLEHGAITTCYLQYEPGVALAQPFFALADDAAARRWGQFVFDRGQLAPDQAGLLAVVVSAADAVLDLPQEELSTALAAQLAQAFARPELAAPQWARVISEKRATFACTPGLIRPPNASGIEGLVLAGDYTEGEYPATLEAAVASGERAAKLVLGGR